jgi:hypothetical protein
MSEKPESEEFEDDEDDDAALEATQDVDVDRLLEAFDKRKKSSAGPKPGEPAWRRLERIREERETADLVSDFDDYDIGGEDGDKPRRRRKVS